LTRALLVLARAEAREESPQLGRVPVAPVLDRIAASLPPSDDVAVTGEGPSTPPIEGDAHLPQHARTSPATHARSHTPSRTIALRGRRENGSVVIEVADTGPGIDVDERERVFDRFYRASDDGSGFGLGLSIARQSVHALGGELELGPAQPVGTTVRLVL